MLKYSSPRLRTINTELRDFDFYVESEFDINLLEVDFNFKLLIKEKKILSIFLHLAVEYKIEDSDKSELFPIYHSDHLSEIPFAKTLKSIKNLDIDLAAHLLGTSIIMVKGYYDTITRGYIVNEYPLPVFNPTELILNKYAHAIQEDKIIMSKLSNKVS